MPNTQPRRRHQPQDLATAADRKRLKSIMADLKLPHDDGLHRPHRRPPAHQDRDQARLRLSRPPVGRDPRDDARKSTAPALIYRDSDLIKRAIRDIYNTRHRRGDRRGRGRLSRGAQDFMKLLMPSHARRVKQYADPVPLFQRYGVEDQLSAMYHPVVQLKSGGYLVINPTEALVSIDINSGRSTREHNIEQTALQRPTSKPRTRSPASCACATWPGLVVIDFIDMEQSSQRPQGREGDEGGAEERSRPHPGRPHLELRPDGDEPPAPAHRRARSLDHARARIATAPAWSAPHRRPACRRCA